MNFQVSITLPEAPDDNLAKQINPNGFVTPVIAPIPPKTEQDVFAEALADSLVADGIIPEARRKDLVFDFG